LTDTRHCAVVAPQNSFGADTEVDYRPVSNMRFHRINVCGVSESISTPYLSSLSLARMHFIYISGFVVVLYYV